MDNAYVDGLKQLDSRPRSHVIIPHNLSELRKKILFENTLLEERALHKFSAGKGDGAGVDTGSAPLKPLTSQTPTPTRTPTPTPTPAPAGIPVASTNTINVVDTFNIGQTISLSKINSTLYRSAGGAVNSFVNGYMYCYYTEDNVEVIVDQVSIVKYGNTWFYQYNGIYNCDTNFSQDYDIATVQEVTSGIIPTTGWSPSLTITVA